MASTNNNVYTPDSVIAAAVPYGKEDPLEVAYNNAAYALDRNDVHLIISVEDNHVFYIAAASDDFAGYTQAMTPLAAALPGMKGHRGDGAYVAASESAYAVVIRKGDKLFSYVGDRQSIESFIASHGVPTYPTSDSMSVLWEGYQMGIIKKATSLARMTILAGIVTACLSILAWIFFATQTASIQSDIDSLRQKANQTAQQTLDELNEFSVQPLQRNISTLQNIAALSSAKGGWVKFFQIDPKNPQGVWEIEMPQWITSEYLAKFGRNIEVEPDREKGILIVTKGERKKR